MNAPKAPGLVLVIQRGVTGSNGNVLSRYQCIMHIRWVGTSDVKVVGVVLSTKRGQEAARVTVGVAGSQQNAAKIALGGRSAKKRRWVDTPEDEEKRLCIDMARMFVCQPEVNSNECEESKSEQRA